VTTVLSHLLKAKIYILKEQCYKIKSLHCSYFLCREYVWFIQQDIIIYKL